MGLVAQCDGGCGASTNDIKTFREFGVAKKVWYCEKCADILSELYEDRDASHTKYAKLLEEDLLEWIQAFQSRLPNARLPDAPE